MDEVTHTQSGEEKKEATFSSASFNPGSLKNEPTSPDLQERREAGKGSVTGLNPPT